MRPDHEYGKYPSCYDHGHGGAQAVVHHRVPGPEFSWQACQEQSVRARQSTASKNIRSDNLGSAACNTPQPSTICVKTSQISSVRGSAWRGSGVRPGSRYALARLMPMLGGPSSRKDWNAGQVQGFSTPVSLPNVSRIVTGCGRSLENKSFRSQQIGISRP